MWKHTTLIFRAISIFSGAILDDYRKAVSFFRSGDRTAILNYALGLCGAFRSLDPDRRSRRPEQEQPGSKHGRCGEGSRNRARPGRSACRALVGFAALRSGSLPEGAGANCSAREETLAGKSDRERPARASHCLSRANCTKPRRQARQAVELDPLPYAAQNNLARILWYKDKLDEADAVARKAAELQPAAASSHRWQVAGRS